MSDELHAGHREGRCAPEAERFWEDHYRRRGRVWSGRPNPVLVDVLGSLPPGRALDLGCGEGRPGSPTGRRFLCHPIPLMGRLDL